jgi:hypothetical protein
MEKKKSLHLYIKKDDVFGFTKAIDTDEINKLSMEELNKIKRILKNVK